MTPATTFSDGGVSYAGTVPSAQGLDIHFSSYQYGGRGADGILFYLAGSDPTHPVPPATLGPPGGHLGYAGGNQAPGGQGLADGYLGVGLDAYGNFSNNRFDGAGCTDPPWMGNGVRIANQVTVRGPGSGLSGYCALGSTAAQGGLTGSLRGGSTATRSASLVPMEIAVNPTAAVTSTPHISSIPAYSYVVAISPLGGPTQYVSGSLPNASSFEPATWLDSTTGIPFQLAMGFAASTGVWHDIHEIRNVTVEPLFANPAQINVQLTDDAAGSLVQGTPVTYTAAGSLTTVGGSLNQATQLVATLPTGVVPGVATGANWSCVTSGQTVTCPYRGSLPIAAGTLLPPVTIAAAVSPGASGPADANVEIVSNNAQIAMATDPGFIRAAGAGVPLLGVALVDSVSGSFVQGGSASYSAQATISSGGHAEGSAVSLSDTLPSGVVPGSAAGSNWNCGTVGQVVTCGYTGSLPIPAGTTLPVVNVPVTVQSTASGAVTNTVSLTSPDAVTAQATDYGSIVSIPQYGLTLTDSGSGNIPAGGSFTYTATPSLLGAGGAESLAPSYSQAVAAGVTVSSAGGTGWSCALLSGNTVVSCGFVGTLPMPGGSFPPITVNASTSLTSGNISSSGTVSSPDGVAATATDAANVAAPPPPILAVTSSGPSLVYQGMPYLLAVTPSIVSGTANHEPVVRTVLPAGETFTPASSTQTGYSCTISATVVANDTLSCTSTVSPPIGTGPLATISANVNVATGTVGAPATSTLLSDAGDNAVAASASSAPTVVPVPRPALSLNAPLHAAVGASIMVIADPSMSASGGPALSAPTVSITAPAGATFPAAPTATGYACSLSTPAVVTCTFSGPLDIAPGSNLPSIAATSIVGSPGSLQFSSSIVDPSDGASPANATATVDVTASPALTVSTSGTPATAPYGSTYSLSVAPSLSPTGGPAYNDPTFVATVPNGETFGLLSGNPTGFACGLSPGSTVLTCTSTAAPPISPGSGMGSPSFTVHVNVGTGMLVTDVVLSDAADGATPATATATVVATPIAQVISFTAPPAGTVGGTAILSATGGASGNPVSFAVDPTSAVGSCTIAGSTVTYTGVGSCVIDANQAGDANYLAAPQVTGTVTIGQGSQVITPSTAPTAVSIATPPYTPTATGGSSGQPVVESLDLLSRGCAYNVGIITFTMVGRCIIDFNQAGTSNYSPAPQVQQNIDVGLAAQYIVFNPPANGVIGRSATLSATGGASGNPVIVAVDPTSTGGACTIHGVVLSYTGVGNCVVDFNQAGNALYSVAPQVTATIAVGYTPPRSSTGYRLAGSDGGVFAFGADSFLGSLASRGVLATAPIVGMAATSDGNGYWLVGSDGNIYAFGTARNFGTPGDSNIGLTKPIVGMAATPDGGGYWEVTSAGGVFAFGDAVFAGSTYSIGIEHHLDKPIMGIQATPDGGGYWLVASDGGIFAFGDAGFFGNTYTLHFKDQLNQPVVGMAATLDGKGYWLVAADGGVFAFGDATFVGNTYTIGIEHQLVKPIVGMAASPDGAGYWLVAADGGLFAFGGAQFFGNTYTIGIEQRLTGPIGSVTQAP